MELMEIIKKRRSIRRYSDRQISRRDMEKIIEAGAAAPNAGGGQRSILVGVHNSRLTTQIGLMNMKKFDRSKLAGSYVSREQPSVIDDPSIRNGFYGAPSVVIIFGQKNFMFRTADAFCCAENMVLQAAELDIASCIISRGEETFSDEEGEKLLREWDIPENYSAVCFVILGYTDDKQPSSKPIRQGRIKIIE